MPKRSNSFQRLIYNIERQVANENVKVTESREIIDSVGDKREIDIAIEVNTGAHEALIAVETRDHKSPATIQWIDELAGKYNMGQAADRIIAVSRSGFTKTLKRERDGLELKL